MSVKGPIILVEDDADDHEIFNDALQSLGVTNKLYWFTNPIEAFKFLSDTTEQPFVIFCDVNLPLQSGIELKKTIDNDKQLREKSIPFIIYSTSVDQYAVNEAYSRVNIQGFFKKGSDFTEIKATLKAIIDYWLLNKHPNCD